MLMIFDYYYNGANFYQLKIKLKPKLKTQKCKQEWKQKITLSAHLPPLVPLVRLVHPPPLQPPPPLPLDPVLQGKLPPHFPDPYQFSHQFQGLLQEVDSITVNCIGITIVIDRRAIIFINFRELPGLISIASISGDGCSSDVFTLSVDVIRSLLTHVLHGRLYGPSLLIAKIGE